MDAIVSWVNASAKAVLVTVLARVFAMRMDVSVLKVATVRAAQTSVIASFE
jgi:transcriptional regulator of NAD metabolism